MLARTTFILFVVMSFTACTLMTPTPAPTSPTISSTPRIILALGDSLTAGYTLPPEDSYTAQLEWLLTAEGYSYQVRNAGISGDTSAQLLARMEWAIGTDTAGTPSLAIVEIGANDAFQGISPSVTEANIRAIVQKLQDRSIPILLTGMKSPPNLGSQYAAKFEGMYRNIAKDMKLPLMDFFLEDVAAIPSLNLADGIHPTREGYAIVAANVLRELKSNKLIQK